MMPHPLKKLSRPYKIWFLIASFLLVAVAVITLTLIAVVKSSDATTKSAEADRHALQIANCVNNVLALRQDTSARDSGITVELWSDLGAVLSATPGQPQKDAYNMFFAALLKDVPVLLADQKFRNTHPLGHC